MKKNIKLFATFVIIGFMIICANQEGLTRGLPNTEFQTSEKEQTADTVGAKIYKENCAQCHGANGGGTKKGISLTSGHALHHSEAEYIEQVTNGEGKKMPAFKDKLSEEEIAEVVKFVRTELQKSKKRTGGHKHSH